MHNGSYVHDTLPTLTKLHAFLYLHEFFDPHGLYSSWKFSNISKTEEAAPTKLDVHAFDINPHLHEFIEPILFDSIF